jgi:uncharacterized protein YndB with AHSA1/START domain
MGLLVRVLGALFVLVVVAAASAYLQPRQLTVTRSVVIEAPPARIFPYLNSLQQVAQWSPWAGVDLDLGKAYAGPAEGVGNRMQWSSADPSVGSGTQRIIASVPDRRVESALDLEFLGSVTEWQDLTPEGDGTRVTWGLRTDLGNSPIGRYRGLMLRRSTSADFDRGLARLKAVVEAE